MISLDYSRCHLSVGPFRRRRLPDSPDLLDPDPDGVLVDDGRLETEVGLGDEGELGDPRGGSPGYVIAIAWTVILNNQLEKNDLLLSIVIFLEFYFICILMFRMVFQGNCIKISIDLLLQKQAPLSLLYWARVMTWPSLSWMLSVTRPPTGVEPTPRGFLTPSMCKP